MTPMTNGSRDGDATVLSGQQAAAASPTRPVGVCAGAVSVSKWGETRELYLVDVCCLLSGCRVTDRERHRVLWDQESGSAIRRSKLQSTETVSSTWTFQRETRPFSWPSPSASSSRTLPCASELLPSGNGEKAPDGLCRSPSGRAKPVMLLLSDAGSRSSGDPSP
jgi:hypothetical protein